MSAWLVARGNKYCHVSPVISIININRGKIVIDGDSMRVDIMEYIKSLFDITVDVLWVDLMEKEDDELTGLR